MVSGNPAKRFAVVTQESSLRWKHTLALSLVPTVVIAAFGFWLTGIQIQAAEDTHKHDLYLELRAKVSDSLDATYSAEETAMRLLKGIEARSLSGVMAELGQKFEDRAIEATVALSAAEFVTAHLHTSSVLAATNERLANARNVTAQLFTASPKDDAELQRDIESTIQLWNFVIVALNDARFTAYCDLALDYEQAAVDFYCPHEQQVFPVGPQIPTTDSDIFEIPPAHN